MNRRRFLGMGLGAAVASFARLASAGELPRDRKWKLAKITNMPIVLEAYTDCSANRLLGFTSGERDAPKVCLTDIEGKNPRLVQDGVFWGFDGADRFITKEGENVVSYDLNGEDKRVLFTPPEGLSAILFGRIPELDKTHLAQFWQPNVRKPRLLVGTVRDGQIDDIISQDGQQPHACRNAAGDLKIVYDVQSADGANSNGICVWQERGIIGRDIKDRWTVENRYLQPGNGRGFRARKYGLDSPRFPAFVDPDLIFFQAVPIGKKEPTIYSLDTRMDHDEVGLALLEDTFISAQRPRPGPNGSVIVAGQGQGENGLTPYILYRGEKPRTTDKGSL